MHQETTLNHSEPIALPPGSHGSLDLTLVPDPLAKAGAIRGVIRDEAAQVLEGVFVELLSANRAPLSHTFTNPGGEFYFGELPTGMYFISATKTGFALSLPLGVAVTAPKTAPVALTLAPEPYRNSGAIIGQITDTKGNPLSDQVRVCLEADQCVVDVHPTNPQGKVAFPNLLPGRYTVVVNAHGFLPSTNLAVEVTPREITQFAVQLAADLNVQNCVLTGTIEAPNGKPIEGATVYLVRHGDEMAIAFTTTNAVGHYVFYNLPPGDYYITANKDAPRRGLA